MTDTPPRSRSTPPGLYDSSQREFGPSLPELIAVALTILWLAVCAVFFFVLDGTSGFDSLRILLIVLAVFMPVGMVWVGATAARSARIMRQEAARLQTAIDGMRQTIMAHQQPPAKTSDDSIARKLDIIAAHQQKTESALAMFTSSRRIDSIRTAPDPEIDPQTATEQPALALGTPAEALNPPLAKADFIRAMNFPETADDEQGFTALRRALKDRQASQLIQASQDVLTLLSQDGIYMDDLRPDRARPEVWRQFATGERGRPIAGLGGIHDRSSLALTAGRMRQDPIFRDAAHHFLRRFDKLFASFAETASDEELSALSDTRTARAFMLLGRVAGTFD